jgi:hypothetical protein
MSPEDLRYQFELKYATYPDDCAYLASRGFTRWRPVGLVWDSPPKPGGTSRPDRPIGHGDDAAGESPGVSVIRALSSNASRQPFPNGRKVSITDFVAKVRPLGNAQPLHPDAPMTTLTVPREDARIALDQSSTKVRPASVFGDWKRPAPTAADVSPVYRVEARRFAETYYVIGDAALASLCETLNAWLVSDLQNIPGPPYRDGTVLVDKGPPSSSVWLRDGDKVLTLSVPQLFDGTYHIALLGSIIPLSPLRELTDFQKFWIKGHHATLFYHTKISFFGQGLVGYPIFSEPWKAPALLHASQTVYLGRTLDIPPTYAVMKGALIKKRSETLPFGYMPLPGLHPPEPRTRVLWQYYRLSSAFGAPKMKKAA